MLLCSRGRKGSSCCVHFLDEKSEAAYGCLQCCLSHAPCPDLQDLLLGPLGEVSPVPALRQCTQVPGAWKTCSHHTQACEEVLIIPVGQVCTQAQRTGLPGLALSTQEVLNL